MKQFLKEFKQFTMRGNVLDMAVGVVVGGAFKAIVDALVNNIISPLIGLLFNSDFSDLALMVGDVSIGYGAFITAVLNFLIVSFTLFVVIKAANKAASLRKAPKETPKAPTTKICPIARVRSPLMPRAARTAPASCKAIEKRIYEKRSAELFCRAFFCKKSKEGESRFGGTSLKALYGKDRRWFGQCAARSVNGGAFVGEQRNDLAGQFVAALCVVCVAGSVSGVNDLHRSHVGFHKNPSFYIGEAGKARPGNHGNKRRLYQTAG